MTSQWVTTLLEMPHCGITMGNDVAMGIHYDKIYLKINLTFLFYKNDVEALFGERYLIEGTEYPLKFGLCE